MKLFSHELRMAFIKRLINSVTPKLISLTRNVKAQTPQSKLIMRVWQRLEDVYSKDCIAIDFNDENFRNLLEAAKNALIYLCEHDKYYKRWIGLLAFFLSEELNKMKKEFTYEDALNMTVRPLMLTFQEFQKHKEALFELHMCGYLYGLARLNREEMEKLRKAKESHQHIDLKTCDGDAYIRYIFSDPKTPHFNMLLKERHPDEFKAH